MTVHELKTWPLYFTQVAEGEKTFELRRDDRHFEVGDELSLCEWHPGGAGYSGREVRVKVTHIMQNDSAFGELIQPGHCIISFRLMWVK